MDKQPEALRLADALNNLEATGACSDSVGLTEWSWKQAEAAAAELRRQHALIAELVEALGRLHASHKDYTDSQQRGWPKNKAHGYPNLEWSIEIEQQARAALSKAKEQQ